MQQLSVRSVKPFGPYLQGECEVINEEGKFDEEGTNEK